MEQGMYLPYVIGVSAGACNAVDYASHQPGRMKLCTIDFLEAGSYVGLKSLVKTHSLFNMDLIFDIFPNKIIPFDYDTFFSSGMECILTATNALTGKAEYLSEKSDRQRLMTCLLYTSKFNSSPKVSWACLRFFGLIMVLRVIRICAAT